MPTKLLLAAAAAFSILLPSSGVIAHRDATGIVKQRMDAMEDMGRAMKALRAMMRGSQLYDAERVRTYAKVIAGHGDRKLTALFPEGSLQSPTRAKSSIWDDWERFAAMARELAVHAVALADAASNERPGGASPPEEPAARERAAMSPDAVFTRLQKNCADCHRAFRERRSDSAPRSHQWAGSRGIQPPPARQRRGRVAGPAVAAVAAVTPASSAAAR